MQVYVISSEVSSTPLAEIRTDGRKLEFLVDNTNGKLPSAVQGSFDRLKQILQHSSHMKMSQPTEATTGILRYVMTNGDIVEITTDGKTALLNGELLSEDEKQALFQAIQQGELTIAHKADTAKPVPVMPTPSPNGSPVQVEEKDDSLKLDPDKVNAMKDYQEQQRKERNRGNKYFDSSIEKSAKGFSDNKLDNDFVRHMMYSLKYGRGR